MPSPPQTAPTPDPSIQNTPGAFPTEPDHPVISSKQTLNQAVYARRAEFTTSKRLKIKVGSWNVASKSGTEKDVSGWFVQGKGFSETLSGLSIQEQDSRESYREELAVQFEQVESIEDQEERRSKKASTIPHHDVQALPAGREIDIYALGLQEIVDISSVTESLRPYSDPQPAKKWKQALSSALPEGYVLVAEQQLLGLLLLIYAAPSVAPSIASVSTTSVGTGLLGYMGNKGAVTARIILGETTRLVFVNSHLAAGVEKGSMDRRNWDASEVTKRTRFEPVHDGGGVMEEFGEEIGDEDCCFWFGDLNYRLEGIPGEDVRKLLMLHTRNEYDITQAQASSQKIEDELEGAASDIKASSRQSYSANHSSNQTPVEESDASHHDNDPLADPTSLQTTIQSLLSHDQLRNAMRNRQAFYDGWREGEIRFLPTYKYDVGSVGMFDSSEKKRGPSWCDRILYRTRRDRLDYLEKAKDEAEAKKRDEEMKQRGLDSVSEERVLYDYDPDTDGAEDDYDDSSEEPSELDVIKTATGYDDRLHLDYYTSHQRVLSSDHKPLDAIFTLDYDAVDPNLKSSIYQEVARELDKAENEGRPTITIVLDRHDDHEPRAEFHLDETIDFRHVRYDVPKTRTATVANTGRAYATFGFVDRSTNAMSSSPSSTAPPWLSISFDRPSNNHNPNPSALREYTLPPGDTLTITFTLRVSDITQVRLLNSKKARLEDVLVLRVYNGRDHFLPVHGKWLHSSFGHSLDKLIRIPEGGVRRLQHQRPDGSQAHSGKSNRADEDGESDDGAVKWSAPKELFRLTEAIETLAERAVAERGMRLFGGGTKENAGGVEDEDLAWPFAVSSVKDNDCMNELVAEAREALDNDRAFAFPSEVPASQKLEAVAQTLLLFLATLEDGIVTPTLWHDLDAALLAFDKARPPPSLEEQKTKILDILSTAAPPHSVLFTLLTFTLSSLANETVPLPSSSSRASSVLSKVSGGLLGSRRSMDSSENNNAGDLVEGRRRAVKHRYSEIFAPVMVRAVLPVRGKGKGAMEGRRVRLVEMFL